MTDVEVHQPGAVATQPTRSEWDIVCAQADMLARAGEIIPTAYRGKPEKIIAAALFGRTVGFDVATSLRLIHVIEGRPTFAADALVAMVRRDGHSLSGETSAEKAVARGRRGDTGDEMSVEWTIEMAKTAGLTGKGTWAKYPQSMLWARAVSQLCRMLFADVTLGMAYTPEELAPDRQYDAQGHPIIEAEVVDPAVAEAARQRAARDDTMAEWAKALTGDQAARWAAWKGEHEGWHKSDSGRNDAYIALGGFFSAEQAGAGAEPFDIVDAELVPDEIVEGEAADREAVVQAPAVPHTESSDSTSPSALSSDDAARSEMTDEGGAMPRLVSKAQLRRLFMLLKAAGVKDSQRHEWAAGWLGHPVGSFNDLNVDEAGRLIDQAEAEAEADEATPA